MYKIVLKFKCMIHGCWFNLVETTRVTKFEYYFACTCKGIHLYSLMSPGKISAVLELWISPLHWFLKGRHNRLGWADQLIGLWLVKTSHITLFSISGLTMGVRTLQTQDTSDLRQFGTISLVPKCLTFLCRYQCRSVSTFYKGAEDSYEGT